MKCPYCGGTCRECGCGTGKCDHCDKGVVADYPLGQPKDIPSILSSEDVEALARYWCEKTRVENLGEFIQRVAYQALTRK